MTTCATCRYYSPQDDAVTPYGKCHGQPPRAMMDPQGYPDMSVRPNVLGDDLACILYRVVQS